jgi:hypothetical protein
MACGGRGSIEVSANAPLLPPNAGPRCGESIRECLDRTRREMTYRTVSSGITVDTVHVYGHFAIYLSTLQGQRLSLGGGSRVPFDTKYFAVLQRSPTGGWQFRHRMWSDNVPSRLPNQ